MNRSPGFIPGSIVVFSTTIVDMKRVPSSEKQRKDTRTQKETLRK
jgi:hypothetical protein